MTDEQLVQMIIDGAELSYGKDSERYELNKDKFTTLLGEKAICIVTIKK